MDLPRFQDPALRALQPKEVHVGLSGARVFHLCDDTGQPVAVFKSVPPDRPDLMEELERESIGMEWLSMSGVSAPRGLADDSALGPTGPGLLWLVTTYLPGTPAHEPRAAREHPRLVELLAEAAHDMHDSHVGCVVEYERLEEEVLERARERVVSGLVARSWRGTGRAGTDPSRALAEVEEKVGQVGPLPEVVTHGDYCLPNVLVTPEGEWGFVDLGKAGLADPHRDLAAMVGSLRNPLNPHFGEADARRFLDAYGRDRVDPELLSLHSEVDAFFWSARVG